MNPLSKAIFRNVAVKWKWNTDKGIAIHTKALQIGERVEICQTGQTVVLQAKVGERRQSAEFGADGRQPII